MEQQFIDSNSMEEIDEDNLDAISGGCKGDEACDICGKVVSEVHFYKKEKTDGTGTQSRGGHWCLDCEQRLYGTTVDGWTYVYKSDVM